MAVQRPILQVALDFVDFDRALHLAEETVAGGADWLEAGTPLIKSEGLQAVRRLKERFPDHMIVADMKIMDAGRTEVEAAARAGAGVVTVLALASDSTILECVEAGHHYGALIVGDLINAPDPPARAQQLAALGVDIIDVHTPIDVQMQGLASFDILRAIAEVVPTRLSVAGGITCETAADAVANGAAIVIVGGAITKAAHATAATQAMRIALDTGERQASALYRRATAESIHDILALVSAANVSNAMHRGGVAPGIHPVAHGMRCTGAPSPCAPRRETGRNRCRPSMWPDRVKSSSSTSGGVAPACWGELATNSAINRKVEGVIIDGASRDTADIIKLGFPVFSKLICPNAPTPRDSAKSAPVFASAAWRCIPATGYSAMMTAWWSSRKRKPSKSPIAP